ncbi:MAG: hypothetical protein ACTS7D_01360 [Candidatus Hodgkinia cicadicola]
MTAEVGRDGKHELSLERSTFEGKLIKLHAKVRSAGALVNFNWGETFSSGEECLNIIDRKFEGTIYQWNESRPLDGQLVARKIWAAGGKFLWKETK